VVFIYTSIFIRGSIMPKQAISSRLQNAKIAHGEWMRSAKNLVENLPITHEMLTLDNPESSFAYWLYSEGLKFRSILGMEDLLVSIEEKHAELQDEYLNIYCIYFFDTKRSFIGSLLFGRNKPINKEQQTQALELFYNLKKISEQLMYQVDCFEKKLMDMDISIIKKCLV